MKRLHLYIIVIITLSGCDKFLDIKPKDKFIPVTVSDFENMLNSGTMVNFGDQYWDLMSDDAFLPEGEPGNLYSKQQPYGRLIYTFNTSPYDQGNNDFMWSEGYKRIFYCNTVINNIMEATEGTDANRKSVRAEAYLFRAMEHLQMVNIYAHHYDAATAASQPGIPIALIADINAKFVRNSVQEVYDQVLSDANAAIADLPVKNKLTKFRASKAGGYALLARTYLFMGDYVNARKNADLALSLQSELADMNDYKIIIPGPFPNVPGAPLGWTDIPDAQRNKETIVARHFLRPFGLGMDVCASPELSALFSNDDKRWTLYYADGWPPAPPFNYMNRYGVKIFLRGDYYSNYLNVPEMYLVRAECFARDNKLAEALADVNKLRENRIVPAAYKAFTPADFDNDAEKVLRFVLEERRREMAFTGIRVIDLKRLNKEARFCKTVKHTAEGVEHELLPGSDQYLRQLWPNATIFNPEWPLNP
ncbi:RagB/SusD family nutrient uptake outer membrane protein [Chitinophaga sp. GCM10012297]|uniref:RagB/SusD family nutrient uptake outer membrane protein n=1 Tax=Chitinophaga chungangae TaxID=2821488 RepID=A0ABS3YFN5_9BACT|nr:RagB/SusD family nutrient uptake outer membrane protein [Chitinophaga chungangae]MBO9153485.1 RagB/SusD family nutrient uptake outer membrane protein [Chitinophaga chungangae]